MDPNRPKPHTTKPETGTGPDSNHDCSEAVRVREQAAKLHEEANRLAEIDGGNRTARKE